MTKRTTMKNTMRKDAVYARQSLDKKDSLSIETQVDKGLKESEGEVEIYEDKGYSGKNTDRPALQRLKADIEADKIKRVIVYRLDRISRTISDFYQLYQLMEMHEVEFVSISENFDTCSTMGRAMMGILIVFAQMERESIQERVKDNYYYRIEEDGRWPGGPAPKGFDNARTSDNKPTLKANDDIEMVKIIFDKYANEPNISMGKIGRFLYDEGYRSNRKNGRFDSVTIARILQNPVYAIADSLLYKYYKMRKANICNDEASWDGTTSAHIVGKKSGNSNTRKYPSLEKQVIYRTNFQGVIESNTFITVQERLATNEQIKRANNPSKMKELAGLVKCADCKYAVKTNNYPKLSCYGRSTLHCCDASFSITFPTLRDNVAIEVQKQLDVISVKILESNIIEKQKNNEIEKLNEEISNLIELAAKSSMDIEQISSAIEIRKKKINEIELSQERNMSFTDQAKISDMLPLKFSRLNDDEKKSVVQLLIKRILLHENGDIDIEWKI